MREIRLLRATWRGLETEPRMTLHGHEGRNPGHSQGESYAPPRQSSTLPVPEWSCATLGFLPQLISFRDVMREALRHRSGHGQGVSELPIRTVSPLVRLNCCRNGPPAATSTP